ncbi:MAG: hypothetical protein KF729_27310 [Sandaracinaceae bacterium]|nr:hypothetical protein [Sandaracinaceae bacterium]
MRARFPALLLGALLLASAPAAADTGHVGLVGGALTLDEGNQTQWRPYARAELGLRLWGPFELGAHLQMATAGFPAELASFGGGVMVQLRPDVALFGFLVPHAEVAGSRVTLPTGSGRLDAWELRVGGGLGFEPGAGFVIEARLHHHWYFDLPASAELGAEGWTVSAGVTYRIP